MYDVPKKASMNRVSCVVNSCVALEHALRLWQGWGVEEGSVGPSTLPYEVIIMYSACNEAMGPTAMNELLADVKHISPSNSKRIGCLPMQTSPSCTGQYAYNCSNHAFGQLPCPTTLMPPQFLAYELRES